MVATIYNARIMPTFEFKTTKYVKILPYMLVVNHVLICVMQTEITNFKQSNDFVSNILLLTFWIDIRHVSIVIVDDKIGIRRIH